MTDPEPTDSARVAETLRRRNYQACLECKRHKVKCNMGSSESPQPPCIRCRRAQLQCVFGPARRLRSRAKRKQVVAHIPTTVEVREGGFQVENGNLQDAEAQGHSESNVHLPEGSSDTAEATAPPADDARATAPGYSLASWKHFNLCRDGYLTPAEADHLVGHFFRWMHPLFPLIDQKYSSRSSWEQLLTRESFICTTILAISSRCTWIQASPSTPRAVEVHGILYRHLQSEISRCIWAPDRHLNTRALGLIEGIMLLLEWHPRSLDLISPPMDISGPYALGSYSFNPCPGCTVPDASAFETEVLNASDTIKALLTATWRLLGIAINLSDEIGLHQVITKVGEGQVQDGADGYRRARLREFLVSLVWETSFRLGRKCVLALPPTPPEPAQPEPANQLSALLDSRTELYRLLQLIESTVYSTPRHTADIITSGRYISIISDFTGYLTAWRSRFDHLKGLGPLRKHLKIIWHSARTFLYSVAVQAFALRCKTAGRRPSGGAGTGPASKTQNFAQSAQHYRDLSLIEDIVNDAEQVLELALELHREGFLRHAPMNLLYHIMAASMLLLKSHLLPVRIKGRKGTGDLMAPLIQITQALEEAGIDDVHACCRFASCFKRLIRKAEADRKQDASRARQPRPAIEAPDPGCHGLESVSEILWPNGDLGATADAAATGMPFGTSFCEGLFSLEQDGDWARWLAF